MKPWTRIVVRSLIHHPVGYQSKAITPLHGVGPCAVATSSRNLHISPNCCKSKSGSVTEDLKEKKPDIPYGDNQSASGTVEEVKESDEAFDPHTVNPKKEMHRMKQENGDKGRSPIDWSGANEDVSPQTK